MNKGWWESLSKSDQTLIEAAISMENDVMTAEFYAKNVNPLKSWLLSKAFNFDAILMKFMTLSATQQLRFLKKPKPIVS